MTNTTELFLVALIIVFAAPFLVWRLGRTDGFAPLVVVQIIAGILLGPAVLGALVPGYYSHIFNPAVIGALNGVAWWAVTLFVFAAGIELDLRQTWHDRRETGLTAGLALFVPLAFGTGAALFMLQWPGWIGSAGTRWQTVLGIGMACAVTALPILVLFLERLELLRAPLGQRILRYASLDDVAIWGVLAIILLDWQRALRQVAFMVLFVVAAFLIRRLMRAISQQDRWYLALIWLTCCSFAADWSGLHFMVGAFVAGAVLDRQWFGEAQVDAFRNTVLLVLMPVFFLSTGLRTSWGIGSAQVFGAAALLLGASVSGKLAGVHLAGHLLGWRRQEASIIGWLLQTKALIMIIFVNILLDRGIISSDTFTALLLMAVGSTMLTIPVVARKLHEIDVPLR